MSLFDHGLSDPDLMAAADVELGDEFYCATRWFPVVRIVEDGPWRVLYLGIAEGYPSPLSFEPNAQVRARKKSLQG